MANSERIERLKRMFRESFHGERVEAKQSVQALAQSLGLGDIMQMIIVNRFDCDTLEDLTLGELGELTETLHTLYNLKAANSDSNVVSFPNRQPK